jgi:hemolysin III
MDAAVERLCLGRMQNPVRGFLHGTAAVLSAIGATFLWDHGRGDVGMQIALTVFAYSLVALYTVSSLYHSVPWRAEWKRRMQRLDHSMIYLVVAGTYTPIAMVVLQGSLLAIVLGATWGITIGGIAQKVFWPRVHGGFSIAAQMFQGWLALPLMGTFARTLPPAAFWLVVAGGLLYTLGAIAFVTRRPRLWPHVFSYHEVFHVFVVLASSLHYAAMLAYVAPLAGS